MDLLEIDISFLNIRMDKLHLEPLAHIDAFNTVWQSAFDGRLKDPDPCPLIGCARANGVEPFSQVVFAASSVMSPIRLIFNDNCFIKHLREAIKRCNKEGRI